MNRVNSRNDLSHDDSTINIGVVIIIIICRLSAAGWCQRRVDDVRPSGPRATGQLLSSAAESSWTSQQRHRASSRAPRTAWWSDQTWKWSKRKERKKRRRGGK